MKLLYGNHVCTQTMLGAMQDTLDSRVTFEGHEGSIINELRLLHHLENKFKAVICHPHTLAPVQEVVVVHYTPTEVRLRKMPRENQRRAMLLVPLDNVVFGYITLISNAITRNQLIR